MRRTIQIPQAGDLLFEKKNEIQKRNTWAWGIIGILGTVILANEMIKGRWPSEGVLIALLIGLLLLFICWSLYFLFFLYLGIVRGSSDDTYQGFFLGDKILFQRISKQIDENFTQKKEKTKILEEIIKEKDEVARLQKKFEEATSKSSKATITGDIYTTQMNISTLERGLHIAGNKLKTHDIELSFNDIKCFLIHPKKENCITVQTHLNYKAFFEELELANKYWKSKAQVVDFLNSRLPNFHNQ